MLAWIIKISTDFRCRDYRFGLSCCAVRALNGQVSRVGFTLVPLFFGLQKFPGNLLGLLTQELLPRDRRLFQSHSLSKPYVLGFHFSSLLHLTHCKVELCCEVSALSLGSHFAQISVLLSVYLFDHLGEHACLLNDLWDPLLSAVLVNERPLFLVLFTHQIYNTKKPHKKDF